MMFFFLLHLFSVARADNVKTIRLCEKGVASAVISTRGTVLEFPLEPEKVILGTKGSFAIEYVRSDLALSPLTSGAISNLFVYLAGRRFVLELSASSTGGHTVYFIKDCLENKEKHHGR
jgi:hypothetical protein